MSDPLDTNSNHDGVKEPEPERSMLRSEAKWLGVHPDVLKLGLVSFLTDVSSEMIFSVFAVFFTTVAGASSALLGLVEGFSDFSASSLDYVAGWLSDKTGKRKAFALAGYGFSTAAKIILLVASSVAALSLFRIIERLGKVSGARHVTHGCLRSLAVKCGVIRLGCTRRSTRPGPCSVHSLLLDCFGGSEKRPLPSGRCSGLRLFLRYSVFSCWV